MKLAQTSLLRLRFCAFHKVYPPDHQEPDFLDQSNHSLAAAAEEPFWAAGLARGLGKPEIAGFVPYPAPSVCPSLTLPRHTPNIAP